MDERASRRYASGYCSGPSKNLQDGHAPDSSKKILVAKSARAFQTAGFLTRLKAEVRVCSGASPLSQ